ncbi:MAG: adenylate/guanylate cyclase domain-containing protein [Acidimicrobiales bacterium]
MPRDMRRLAAIVAADVAGFSRLVGADEEGTLASLRLHRRELIDPLLEEHGGRIANTAGDSLLIEFASVVDAVRSMTAVQEAMAHRNDEIEPAHRIVFRVGINVGDVVSHGEDLLGDGVNIAARLEGICEPGGIVLSDDAHRYVRDRLEQSWEDGGEHTVKNIARPVHVWRWLPDGHVASESTVVTARSSREGPSIAVLPFDNMSGDSEQEYFSDGIAEDLITSLSKLRWVFVIARNSTFTYKGTAVKVQDVGRELGVRYVLEGSVRRSGDRVRITAQLVETSTGNHLWAERYDRDLTDVFDVQDEITTRIVAELDPAILGHETHAALAKAPSSLQAWDRLLRGLWHVGRYRRESNLEARSEFERALELDPHYARALAWVSSTHVYDVMFNWTDDKAGALRQARTLAVEARSLDEKDPFCHVVVAAQCFWTRHLAEGRRAAERVIELDPNSFAGHYILGGLLNYLGDTEASVQMSERALQLSPNDPVVWHCMGSLAHANYNLKRYERAIDVADRAMAVRHGYLFGRIIRAAALAQLGRTEDAATALEEIRSRVPDFSAATFDYYPFEVPGQREHLVDGLVRAGLSD